MWGVCLIPTPGHTEVVKWSYLELKDKVMVFFFFSALVKQGLFDLKLQHDG